MKPIQALKRLDLVCWPTLLIGLQRGWAIKSDVSDYAKRLLSANLDGGVENISELTGADSLDDSVVKELLLQLVDSTESPEAIEKWRLSALIALRESSLSQEEKLENLQELYAEFDYPEDMTSCSIYSQDSVDPLVAMSGVISALNKKFIGRKSVQDVRVLS